MREDGKRDEGQRDAKMTLGLVLVQGWRRRSPKPTSHHPGPQPSWSSRCLPWAPGAGAGALPTLGGLREAGESKTTRLRHGNVIARPLEQRPWQELCWERSVSLLPASRDTRAVPKVTRAALAAHKGIQSLPAGRNRNTPSSALFPTWGILCYLQLLHHGPQDLDRFPLSVPSAWAAAPCSGWDG